MENVINKQYPDLMVDKTIMYVHGFMSSARSGTVSTLKEMLPSANIIAEDLPVNPNEAVGLLKQLCQQHQPNLIIGTSMGGMYSEMLKGYHRILVNPAFQMGETMQEHHLTGKQTFVNPRKNGEKEVIITKQIVNLYKEITQHNFQDIAPDEQQKVWGMFGDNDPLVHTFDLFSQHYTQAIRFHGAHQLTNKVIYHYLIPVIRWIDDAQMNRQRSVIYIDFDCLHDRFFKATPSMRKAFELLIEQYRVYIVAAVPHYQPQKMAETQQWVDEFLSASAYNHLLFNNQPHLLYGDYYITPHANTPFIGTVVQYGSADFKTWEELIIYFDRLRGQ